MVSSGVRSIKWSCATLLLASVAQFADASGQAPQVRAVETRAVIDGIVIDSTATPLRGADIALVSPPIHVGTGENGRFQIVALVPGNYVLIGRRLGYRPALASVRLGAGDTLRLSITLEPLVAELDPMTVVAKSIPTRMAEFEERRSRGDGHFITSDDIERRNSTYATELLRNIPGILVRPAGTPGRSRYFATSSRMPYLPRKSPNRVLGDTLLTACWTQVMIDGVLMSTPYDLDMLPSPRDIAGIEVYAGPATLPAAFQGVLSATCGVIIVWTKVGS